MATSALNSGGEVQSKQAGGRQWRELDGEVAPVEIGRREVVGKVREGEAERLAGLIEGEKGWRRGFDDEVKLAGV